MTYKIIERDIVDLYTLILCII